MVERKILVATVIIVIISLVGGYFAGHFLAPIEKVTTTSSTTITEIQTITTTSTWNITETSTRTLHVPDYSKAIIRSHLIFNGSILVTYSIDKPTYSIGEIVHIKSTITNLTPNNITNIRFGGYMIEVRNSSHQVWTDPVWMFRSGPPPGGPGGIELLPGETKILEEWMTADWNMHELQSSNPFVSEGQYTVTWPTDIGYTVSGRGIWESIHETISFTITK